MTGIKTYPISHFSALTAADLERVWGWRNQSEIRRNMHNDAPISWEEHLSWFDKLLSDESRQVFIFKQNARPIGVLNFSQRSQGVIEWGCYLGETDVWPGSGLLLEIAALDYAATQIELSSLYAEVLSFNQSVVRMHVFFGYQPLPDRPGQMRNDEPYVVNVFSYELDEWRKNRTRVLARLPKQICAAADLIQFT
jgi:UDP-4-amino-4,6-dideoxy-N-acetyl-beta-L-altrosamine N-acetyltransferase